MDDLIIYISALLKNDEGLLAIFNDCGLDAVSLVEPNGREAAAYPRIVLDADDGAQNHDMDSAPPRYFDGVVRLEIVTRTDDNCPDPTDILRRIQARCQALLIGDETAGTETLDGIYFDGASGKQWNVTQWRQTACRWLPASPLYRRQLTTFVAQIYRIAG